MIPCSAHHNISCSLTVKVTFHWALINHLIWCHSQCYITKSWSLAVHSSCTSANANTTPQMSNLCSECCSRSISWRQKSKGVSHYLHFTCQCGMFLSWASDTQMDKRRLPCNLKRLWLLIVLAEWPPTTAQFVSSQTPLKGIRIPFCTFSIQVETHKMNT